MRADRVRPDAETVAAFPVPCKVLTGLYAYYRRFIPNFSKIADSLTRLTREDQPFARTTEQDVRQRMQTAPALAHIRLGAVRVQRHGRVDHVIAFASLTLSRAESNCATSEEEECLAVVWATTKLRPYLYGRPFKVVTDHYSLCWLTNLRDPSGRLARWSLR